MFLVKTWTHLSSHFCHQSTIHYTKRQLKGIRADEGRKIVVTSRDTLKHKICWRSIGTPLEAMASPAVLLDFQLFFSVTGNVTAAQSDSDFVRLPPQTYSLFVFCDRGCGSSVATPWPCSVHCFASFYLRQSFNCAPSHQILATPLDGGTLYIDPQTSQLDFVREERGEWGVKGWIQPCLGKLTPLVVSICWMLTVNSCHDTYFPISPLFVVLMPTKIPHLLRTEIQLSQELLPKCTKILAFKFLVLSHDATLARYVWPCLCSCSCSSQVGVLPKRPNISHKQRHTTARQW